MDAFDTWITFAQTITAVAVTLLAISFLTFQVKSDIWRERSLKQLVAVSTLAELSAPIFFFLIAFFPGHPWIVAGQVVGAAGYALIASHIIVFVRHRAEADRFDRIQMLGVLIFCVTFSVLFWWHSIFAKSVALVWMLFSGLWEAWYFLRTPSHSLMNDLYK
jgi:hypothetical protein